MNPEFAPHDEDANEASERNENLEYDLWEGQFSLLSSASSSSTSSSNSKAAKNAKNMRKLDRTTTLDIENLIDEFESANGKASSLFKNSSRQLSLDLRDESAATSSPVPCNLRNPKQQNGFSWQQSLARNEELAEEVRLNTTYDS